MSMVKVIAQFRFKPGNLGQVKKLAKELVDETRKEKGCIQYDLMQANTDENFLLMLETWESADALDAHSASAHFTRIVPELAALCTHPPAVDRVTQLF